jgi:hypothetical protein
VRTNHPLPCICLASSVAIEPLPASFGYRTAARHSDHPCCGVDAGNYKWNGIEYKMMAGVNGLIAPYFSGWCSFLSRKLVEYIVETDWPHTVMVGQYGTTADDANTGKWVQYATEKHGVQVDFVSKEMVTDTTNMKKSN